MPKTVISTIVKKKLLGNCKYNLKFVETLSEVCLYFITNVSDETNNDLMKNGKMKLTSKEITKKLLEKGFKDHLEIINNKTKEFEEREKIKKSKKIKLTDEELKIKLAEQNLYLEQITDKVNKNIDFNDQENLYKKEENKEIEKDDFEDF